MGYTRGGLTAIAVVFSLICTLAAVGRAYCFKRYANKFETYDGLLIAAYFLTLTAGVAVIIGCQMKFFGGHSLPQITEVNYVRLNKFEIAFWVGNVLDVGCIKLSILLFLRRIFRGTVSWTWFDVTNWILIVLVATWTVVFFFFELLPCGAHLEYAWTTKFWLQAKCLKTGDFMLSAAASNWAMDLAIFIEPIVKILTMSNLRTRYKAQACVAFLLSIIAVAAGCIRIFPWIAALEDPKLSSKYINILGVDYLTADLEGEVTVIVFWTYVEMVFGFIVASLLPAAKLFDALSNTRFYQSVTSLVSSRRSGSKTSGNDVDAQATARSDENEKPLNVTVTQTMNHSVATYDRELANIDRIQSFEEVRADSWA